MVRSFQHSPAEHQPQQARCLEPEDFWNVVALHQELGEDLNFETGLVAFAALSCIRCVHLARSKLEEETLNTLFFHCEMGKSRKMGKRPPYSWAIPRPTFLGEGPFQQLLDIHKSMDDPYFIIPALAEKKGDASTRLWRPEPMEHAQWLSVIRRVMGMIGAGQHEIKEFTFNSARRFMPTAAHVLGFPADTRQAIGSWKSCQRVKAPSGAR